MKDSSGHLIAQGRSRKHPISGNATYGYVTMWMELSHTLKMEELGEGLRCYLSPGTCVGSKPVLTSTVDAKRNVPRPGADACWRVVG